MYSVHGEIDQNDNFYTEKRKPFWGELYPVFWGNAIWYWKKLLGIKKF
jgi:hypothetical protein